MILHMTLNNIVTTTRKNILKISDTLYKTVVCRKNRLRAKKMQFYIVKYYLKYCSIFLYFLIKLRLRHPYNPVGIGLRRDINVAIVKKYKSVLYYYIKKKTFYALFDKSGWIMF